jgi:small subunit ribosomal protein S3Ae
MAVGKNQKQGRMGKKGGRAKKSDPFLKKEWYDIKAPSIFTNRQCGKTLVTKSQGTKLASDGLKGRVLELNLADLMLDAEDMAHKKVKLVVEEVQGRNCLTDFHGMSITRDKHCSLIRKWHTLIEGSCDIKTTDGYLIRMFCMSFTARMPDQVKSNCYAQSSKVRKVRKKMIEIMTAEGSKCQLRDLVKKLIPESIAREVEKQTRCIFPLKDTLIRKVKVMRKPKFDITKLMEMHGQGDDDDPGVSMLRPEGEDAQNVLAAEVAADVDEE